MLAFGLLLLLLTVSRRGQGIAAAAVASEPPAAEPHHLVWDGVNLEIPNSKRSHNDAGRSRHVYVCICLLL